MHHKPSEGRGDTGGEGRVRGGRSGGSREKLALRECSLGEALFQALCINEVLLPSQQPSREDAVSSSKDRGGGAGTQNPAVRLQSLSSEHRALCTLVTRRCRWRAGFFLTFAFVLGYSQLTMS